MKPTKQRCDINTIDDYLAGRLKPAQQEAFEARLGESAECQRLLEERAASVDVWSNARALLSPDAQDRETTGDGESENTAHRSGMMVIDSLAPTDDPEMLGRLGEYEISGVVGVGGMGAVLRGFDTSLRRVVAIKVMAPHLADSGPARTRFQREARAAAAITHDNIIDIYGVAESNGLPYIVMPFARGPSLQKRIDQSGPMTAIEVVRIGKQIASGLSAAHEQGLVHRDIKPANILLNVGIERLWITDFGVARAMDDASMTKTGVIAGTPQYMSPEQARGESVDHRSDLFSLGSVLYIACTGRAPFRSEAAYGILRRITDTDPRPIHELNPDVPSWLCQIIHRLMAKHPDDRFQSAAEVAEILEGCLAHMQQPASVALPACVRNPNASGLGTRLDAPVAKGDSIHTGSRWSRATIAASMIPFFLVAMVAGAWQITEPQPIEGAWTGESWKTISLASVEEASGWYNGTFIDTDGRRGAIQLEWSRVQRRYNGRWKSGDDYSGAITLRVGNQGRVFGAVSADPENPIRNDQPRLREFSWDRSSQQAAQNHILGPTPSLEQATRSVQSPIKGVIVRVGDGVRENAYVKKGDLVFVLAPNDRSRIEQLETVQAALLQNLDTQKSIAAAREREAQNELTSLHFAEQRLKSYEVVQREIVAGADVEIETQQSRVKSAIAARDAAKGQVAILREDLKQKEGLDEDKLGKAQFVQAAKSKLVRGESRLADLEAAAQEAANELVVKEKDRNAKQAKTQVDIDYTKAIVQKAKATLKETIADADAAKAKISTVEKEIMDTRAKLSKVQRLRIMAPIDGYLQNVLQPDQVLKEGDELFQIRPATSSDSNSLGTDRLSAAGPPASQSQASSNPLDATADSLPVDSLAAESFQSESPLLDSLLSGSWPARTALDGLPSGFDGHGQNLMAALSVVNQLSNEIRRLQSEIATVEQKLPISQSPSSQATLQKTLDQLRSDFDDIQSDKSAILRVLRTRREAAQELQGYQEDLKEQANKAFEAGRASAFSPLRATLAYLTADSELQLLDQLIEFYTRIDQVDPTAQRKAIIAILNNQVGNARALSKLQAEITARVNVGFDNGQLEFQEALEARKALTEIKARQQELQVLLDHYDSLDDGQ